jgi:DNA polymerase-1
VDKNGRVHTSFNQTVAATGRLSSQDPNLQNIPVRTEVGREIRRAFVARGAGYCLLAADYSQIELRILAHISGDKTLKKAFANDEDVHRRTAAAVYGVDVADVTPEMRAVAKTANFAIIYGVSAFGLSQQTDLDVGEAREFIDTYFERYPKVKEYMEGSISQARTEGYVSTLLGRRRFLPEINADNRQRREFAERIAINTPIQGTAADLIKLAMIKIHARLAPMKSRMVLQVHDELVFDVLEKEADEVTDLVRTEMEGALKLDVPLKVDIGKGANWLEAK